MNPRVNEDQLREALLRYWGYHSFLPHQLEAMQSVVAHRDSVVVLPTGGGKSLCFQVPSMCMPGMAVVVSPLISLMKDQVDSLRDCGVPAAYANSTLSYAERRQVSEDVRNGRIRLLYVAPERLLGGTTLEFIKSVGPSLIAIDEAHCISAWGHDFRPEYRELRALRTELPGVGIHAYTATATERVRRDIAEQLLLDDPQMTVGSFDRPNLVYRVVPRSNQLSQIRQVLDRHRGESGIVYCITRRDVERITNSLCDAGYKAIPYHAGMEDRDRRRNQEAFINDTAETIVATVAFGMGIDKPNVRYVIHAGMPKSLEGYQQESGRAGRDGLEAECVLFYSGQDFMVWKQIVEDSEVTSRQGALSSLTAIWNLCTGVTCRHHDLVEYFGQSWQAESCSACDVCLGELDLVDDPLIVGQKIVSCVLRLNEQFGGDYTAKVLTGSNEEAIVRRRHDRLSTWGILQSESKRAVRDWIEQLASQQFLRKEGDYNVLRVTEEGRRMLRGETHPRLLRPVKPKKRVKAAKAVESWEGVDRGLFDALRTLRRDRAQQKNVPPYIVFGDAALREMARHRPANLAQFADIRGVGDKKLEEYGEQFVQQIVDYCEQYDLATQQDDPALGF